MPYYRNGKPVSNIGESSRQYREQVTEKVYVVFIRVCLHYFFFHLPVLTLFLAI